MIRDAKIADLMELSDFAMSFIPESAYAHINIDPKIGRRTMANAINSATGFLQVSVRKEGIDAMLMGMEMDYWMSTDKYATDILFVSRNPSAAPILARNFERWAWQRPKVVDVNLGVSSGIDPEGVGAFYQSLGYNLLGPMCMKVRPELEVDHVESC